MDMDNVHLISEIEKSVTPDSRVSRNQIKTRNTSFQSIYKHWRDHRSKVLNQNLNNLKDDLVKNMSTADYQEIQKNNNIISSLDEKIDILSKADVPSKYIKHRAIKLREKMMNSVLFNSAKAYVDKVFEKPAVFTPEVPKEVEVNDFVTPPVVESMAAANTSSPISVENVANEQEKVLANEIDRAMGEAYYDEQVVPEVPIERQDIEQVVEEALNTAVPQPVNEEVVPSTAVETNEIQQVVDKTLNTNASDLDATQSISKEDIQEAVEDGFSSVDNNVVAVSPEEVAEVVNDAYDRGYQNIESSDLKAVEPVAEESNDESEINYSHLKDAVDQALADIKMSQNESSTANVDLLPPHVEEEPFEYKPMTDEEIAQARENIEYDKYEKVYADEWANADKAINEEDTSNVVYGGYEPIHDVVSTPEEAVREDVVVVPDRDEAVEKEDKYSTDENLHFDYSEATNLDLVNASEVEDSIAGLSELKERALKLKEANKQSKLDLDDAKNAQADEARRAIEVRNANLSKKSEYFESLRRLQEYCESLEQDTKENLNSAESARNDTEVNRRFIQSQYDEINEYDDRMKEIESIISDEDVSKRR